MSWRQRVGDGLAVVCLVLAAANAQAGPYSNLYVFGDSLSDSGNDLNITGGEVPSPAYYTDGVNVGRFANGLNYADRLATALGLSLTPSTAGGNDYAYGGARSTYVRPELLPYGALSFEQQVGQYLGSTGGTVDPNALYVLWIGANDMSDAFGLSLAAGGDPALIGTAVGNSVGTLLTALGTLETLGAKHFVVGNVPDLGLLPAVRSAASLYSGGDPAVAAGITGLATAAATAFNNALAFYLPASTLPGVDLTLIDAFGLLTDMTGNPAAYGLSNVTDSCYNGQVDGTATPGAGPVTVCANPDQNLYFDTEHPAARVHQMLANDLYVRLVPEPAAWALCLTALGLLGFMRRRPASR